MDDLKVKFLVAIDSFQVLVGTITDGDIRRGILRGVQLTDKVSSVICCNFTAVHTKDGLKEVLEKFQNPRIEFLPILDKKNKIQNIITRKALNVLLLRNQTFCMDFDFTTLDDYILEHEIFVRPWGFYKTTILNNMFLSKIIHIMPGQALSLQSHQRREEYWIIVNGTGVIQLGKSTHKISPGESYFIPKDCKHRLINTSEIETLIFVEVQLGDYFGEDDIERYEDRYNRF